MLGKYLCVATKMAIKTVSKVGWYYLDLEIYMFSYQMEGMMRGK